VLDELKANHIDPESITDRHWIELHSALESGARTDLAKPIMAAHTPC